MEFNKINVKDRELVGGNKYNMDVLTDGRVQLTPAPDTVTVEGTPIDAELLQPIEDTVDDYANSHKVNVSNPHKVTKAQIGLGNVPNKDYGDEVTLINNEITDLQNYKVDKIDGKGLSTNDYTDYYKGQLDEYISRNLKDWEIGGVRASDSAKIGYWGKVFSMTWDGVGTYSDGGFIFSVNGTNYANRQIFGILKLAVKFNTDNVSPIFYLQWQRKSLELNLDDFVAIHGTNSDTIEIYTKSLNVNHGVNFMLIQTSDLDMNLLNSTLSHYSYTFYKAENENMLQTLPSGTQYVSTMLDQTLTTNSVEPAYDSLNAIDYNKEYGYVIDDTPNAGATWGKIFSYKISQIYTYATFVFDVNYGYLNRERVGRLKLYTRMMDDKNTLAEAYLYFESKSESLYLSMFKVRRYENKAEIYVKTALRYEGVSLKLVQAIGIDGKTYLQNRAISNFTLHNVKNPTLTNTDIDNLSGEVTIPTLIPQTLNGNELTINGQTYNSTFFDDWEKLRDLIYAKNDEVVLNTTLDIGGEEIKYYNTDNSQTQVANFTELYRLTAKQPTVLWSGSVTVKDGAIIATLNESYRNYDKIIIFYSNEQALNQKEIDSNEIPLQATFLVSNMITPMGYATASLQFLSGTNLNCFEEFHSDLASALTITKVVGYNYGSNHKGDIN